MKNLFSRKTPLIVIDVQKGFDDPVWGKRNNPQTEENIARLMQLWRQNDWPVIHVHHCSLEENSPLREDHPGNQVKDSAAPKGNEKIFKKNVNSAFIGTGLEEYLRENDYQALLVVGLTTDHCVSTSVRMAGNLGFQVHLVADATATFDKKGPDGVLHKAEQIHSIHLASLDKEFCTVCSTESILKSSNC